MSHDVAPVLCSNQCTRIRQLKRDRIGRMAVGYWSMSSDLDFGRSPHGGTQVLFCSMLFHFLSNTDHSFQKYGCVNHLCPAWIHPQLVWLCS